MVMLIEKKSICVICAWRDFCQKKFSLPPGRNCPDFTRDVRIREESKETSNYYEDKKEDS